jgi:hypothetical protein
MRNWATRTSRIAARREETYGDCSITFDFFRKPSWRVIGHDWSRIDLYQVSVILCAV